MTTIRIDDAVTVQLLLAHLRSTPDVVAELTGPNTLNVRIMGSYRTEAMHMELTLRLRAWQETQRTQGHEVHLDLLPGD